MPWQSVLQFIRAHEEVIGLFALAVIVTMREELPPPFDAWPWCAWVYGWVHDALKTFVSFRAPASAKKNGGDDGDSR